MIMDLPNHFSKYDCEVIIENGILKVHKHVPFRKLIYELTYAINGGKHNCHFCNSVISHKKVSLDHMFPQDMGGPTITNNLTPCCLACNSQKSNMTLGEYKHFLTLPAGQERKVYFQNLQKKKEIYRKLKMYQMPHAWLCEQKVSDILVLLQLDNIEDFKKYKRVEEFYKSYGYFQKPITIDKNGFLLDGFYTVMYAKNNGISSVKAVMLENVEIFF